MIDKVLLEWNGIAVVFGWKKGLFFTSFPFDTCYICDSNLIVANLVDEGGKDLAFRVLDEIVHLGCEMQTKKWTLVFRAHHSNYNTLNIDKLMLLFIYSIKILFLHFIIDVLHLLKSVFEQNYFKTFFLSCELGVNVVGKVK